MTFQSACIQNMLAVPNSEIFNGEKDKKLVDTAVIKNMLMKNTDKLSLNLHGQMIQGS